ncbi:MAG: hypothetical protein ACRCW1_04750 [Anaerotignaceae bacterium]
MIKNITKLIETTVIEEVYCNKCGKQIKTDNFGHFMDYVHIVQTWGYYSKKDTTTQTIDICEDCWDEFIESCKIKI